ncbi:MAG: hypothetical protein LBR34_10605 [Prevotella sp.]|jgi:hypothetical protein|nr:hypothetical protein [Prevotella sp.]
MEINYNILEARFASEFSGKGSGVSLISSETICSHAEYIEYWQTSTFPNFHFSLEHQLRGLTQNNKPLVPIYNRREAVASPEQGLLQCGDNAGRACEHNADEAGASPEQEEK